MRGKDRYPVVPSFDEVGRLLNSLIDITAPAPGTVIPAVDTCLTFINLIAATDVLITCATVAISVTLAAEFAFHPFSVSPGDDHSTCDTVNDHNDKGWDGLNG